MDFEPWWLIIIPVLFALGWVAGRVDFRQMLSETKTLPDSYFKGLNFLLNEQPDRAIDAFIEVAKLDPETTELHFALGSLFRRRGEIERAIRVHQSLLSRSDLPIELIHKAQNNLAHDFMKAGLLDRAETVFVGLLDTPYSLEAIKSLVRIYESGHEWDKAIKAVEKLQNMINEPVPQLAHYYCEQAHSAMNTKSPDLEIVKNKLNLAQESLTNTEDENNTTVARVLILKAELEKIQSNHKQQLKYLEQVLQLSPNYASLIAQEFLDCHSQNDNLQAGIDILMQHYKEHSSLEVFAVLFNALMQTNEITMARSFAHESMQNNPSLLGLQRVLKLEISYNDKQNNTINKTENTVNEQLVQKKLNTKTDTNGFGFIDLNTLNAIVSKHSNRLDRYLCKSCGFEARHYYWQCPGCNGWETYQPLRLEEIK